MNEMNMRYDYHLGVYSKLIQGRNPNGAIKRGTEARVNGKTADFPVELHSLCRPSLFFAGEPLITDVDPRLNWGGVFVYQPIQIGGVFYSAFGRVQARSEGGLEIPGRKFTHCAVIFVEQKWEPGLIKWAAEMLFTDIHGEHCWGDPITEMDSTSNALPVPELTRAMLKDVNIDGTSLSSTDGFDAQAPIQIRGQVPKLGVQNDNRNLYPEMAAQIAGELIAHDLRLEGRWLSLAFGIGTGASGHGAGGFFVRFDTRNDDQASPAPQLHFDDLNRARRFEPISSSEKSIGIYWSKLKGAGEISQRFVRLTNDNILWPDQIAYLDGGKITEPYIAPAAPVKPSISPMENLPDRTVGVTPLVLDDPVSPIQEQPNTPEPLPETPAYLNIADDAYADVDHLAYDHIFDPDNLEKIRPAFRQIIGRCQLLDPENGYDNFDISADFEKYTDALQHLVEYVCIYATLADVKQLLPFMDDLLTHEQIPVLELPATSRGGLSQLILSIIFDIISHSVIHEWVAKQARIEVQLKIQKRNKREIDQYYQVYNPQRQKLDSFFSWLNDVDFLSDKKAAGFSGHYERIILKQIHILCHQVAVSICEKWDLLLPNDMEDL